MTKFVGKKADFGIAKETTRGTAESSATFWLPKMELSIDDQVEVIEDPNSVGVIEDVANIEVRKKFAEGDFQGAIEDDSFGLVLLGLTGAVQTSASTPENGVTTHTFTVSQTSQHQSLTLFIDDDNQDYSYANGVIDSLEVNAVRDNYANFTATFRALDGSTGTFTPSYTSQNRFLPKHMTLELASTQSGLDNSGTTDVRSVTMSFEKSTEDDDILGSETPNDFLSTMFSVTGSIELVFNDETFKTEMLNDTVKAMRLRLINSGVTIGSSTNPEIQFDLHAFKVTDYSRNYSNDSISTASVEFKAYYKSADSALATITLINTTASY